MTPAELAKSGTEHAHQRALFAWLNKASRNAVELDTGYWFGPYPQLAYAFAIPNGGLRNRVTAGRLKAEGVKSGVPDIFIPVPRNPLSGSYFGLFIEMKRPSQKPKREGAAGGTSSEQLDYHAYLKQAGYRVEVCYSWQEAVYAVCRYFNT